MIPAFMYRRVGGAYSQAMLKRTGRWMQGMTRTFVIAAVGVAGLPGAAGLGGCTKQYSDRDIRPITLADVRKLAASDKPSAVLLVDPRPPADYQTAHLPGARSLGLSEVKSKSDGNLNPELAAYTELIVYGDDPASAIARAMTKRLMEAGHERVRMFAGGLSEWRRAGLRVDTGAGATVGAK
jgi:rhodanese-related sulfurtransferase